MIRTGHSKFGFLRMTFAACVGIPLIIASNAFAQNLAADVDGHWCCPDAVRGGSPSASS